MNLKKRRKILLISALGTTLEFYDFTLYGVFAYALGKTFFPPTSDFLSTMSAFGVFAAGFFMRPLGAYIMGSIGDRWGRQKALSLSIFCMGIPAFVTGLMPSFDEIGYLAPCLITLCRMLQGLSAGGEFNGAAIFVLEHLGHKRRGFYSSWISVSGGVGAIMALSMGALIELLQLPPSSFRIPFLLGGLVSFLGFYMRRALDESPEFDKKSASLKAAFSLKDLWKHHPKALGLTFSMGALDGTLAYSLVGFLPFYISHFLGLTQTFSTSLSTLGLMVYIVATPLAGILFDRVKTPIFWRHCLPFLMVGGIFSFGLLKTKVLALVVLGEVVLALMFASISGTQHAFMQELFPAHLRYRGISLGYNLGGSLLGGLCPAGFSYLIHQWSSLMIPAYWITLEVLCLGWFLTSYRTTHAKSHRPHLLLESGDL